MKSVSVIKYRVTQKDLNGVVWLLRGHWVTLDKKFQFQ